MLLKFSIIHGFVHAVFLILQVYLIPLQLVWFASVSRATVLLLASVSTLPVTSENNPYDKFLHPLLTKHRPEIDAYLSDLRSKWTQLNTALQELAIYSLNRIAIGGLPALISLPSALSLPHGTITPTATSNTEADVPTQLSLSSVIDDRFDDIASRTSRATIFAQPDEKADAIVTAITSRYNLNGAIQSSNIEPPKPAFESARVMRQRFRLRAEARCVAKKNSL